MQMEYRQSWKDKITRSLHDDPDSVLGTYAEVNPNCISDHIRSYNNMLELERVTITRYRTGSHNLKIEKGRHAYPKIPREQRLCTCNDNVQSLRHILFECTLLDDLRRNATFTSTEEFFKWNGAANYIFTVAKRLKVQL